LAEGDNQLSLTGPPLGVLETAGKFILSGIEHIFIGLDHIAFLAALLLWATSLWSLVKIVTAFTVAHSVTLTLAVLDVLSFPEQWVEAAIALSIIYVAGENFFRRDAGQKWKVTFLLGLLHGLGFAGALKDLGLPTDALVTALITFNVGVEIGQIALVVLGMGLLFSLDRVMVEASDPDHPRRHPAIAYTGSMIILLAGLYWLLERTILS